MQVAKYFQFIKTLVKGDRFVSYEAKSIFDIDFQALRKDHELVIFDYDDTLSYMQGDLSDEVKLQLKYIQSLGFKIAVVSNCTFKRYQYLKTVFDKLDIFISPNRNKPSPEGILRASEHYNIPLDRAVSIGDRIGTECYGSKLAGIKTIILVNKYSVVFNCRPSFPPLNWLDKIERKIYFSKDNRE